MVLCCASNIKFTIAQFQQKGVLCWACVSPSRFCCYGSTRSLATTDVRVKMISQQKVTIIYSMWLWGTVLMALPEIKQRSPEIRKHDLQKSLFLFDQQPLFFTLSFWHTYSKVCVHVACTYKRTLAHVHTHAHANICMADVRMYAFIWVGFWCFWLHFSVKLSWVIAMGSHLQRVKGLVEWFSLFFKWFGFVFRW